MSFPAPYFGYILLDNTAAVFSRYRNLTDWLNEHTQLHLDSLKLLGNKKKKKTTK